jgi:arylformamidase
MLSFAGIPGSSVDTETRYGAAANALCRDMEGVESRQIRATGFQWQLARFREGYALIPDLTPEQLSVLYNNRLAVPDYADYLARWQKSSAALRDREKYRADIAYGPRPRNLIDLFVPDAPGSAPLLVYLHGGYWQMLGKHDWSWVAEPWLARGMAVAIVGYTLCPETTVAGIVAEVEAACADLYRNADVLGIDLAAASLAIPRAAICRDDAHRRLAQTRCQLPRRLFRSAVAISGVFDLEPLTQTLSQRR